MSRSKAALLHFWPSMMLLLLVALPVFFLWYPNPFWQFHDTAKFPLMMVLLAVLIGPALTGLVYKKNKRSLVFDLAVIIIIQLTAVAWASLALYQTRPFFMVFTIDRFEVLSKRDVDPTSVSTQTLLKKPLVGPIMLYASMPKGASFQKLLREVMLEGKPDLQYRPEFWSMYSDRQQQALGASKALSKLRAERPGSAAKIDKLVQELGGDIDLLAFVPATHQNGQFAAILDAKSGQVLDSLIINPWID